MEQLPDLQESVDILTAKVDSLTTEIRQNLGEVRGEMTAKVDGIRQDLGEVRGGHARSAVLRNAALVADGLNCQLISEVPRVSSSGSADWQRATMCLLTM